MVRGPKKRESPGAWKGGRRPGKRERKVRFY